MRFFLFIFFLSAGGVLHAQHSKQFSDAVVIYMSRHGTVAKVAGMIKDSCKSEPVTLINLKNVRNPNVSKCDLIVIGGSIHVGKIQKKIQKFCRKNEELLLTKKLGLFICCMFTGDEARKEFENAFSGKLRNHAIAKGLMGYELLFERMDMVERTVMKKLTGESKDVYKLDIENFNKFMADLRK